MKVALTADVHLTDKERNPERYQSLENLLNRLLEEGIDTLIVAGDLFDESLSNYDTFDALCSRADYAHLQIYVIPGNHDAALSTTQFAAGNIQVLEEPVLVPFGEEDRPFLFVPYTRGQSMGEAMAPLAGDLPAHDWVLVGHGDWLGGLRRGNPYEPGVYMPLTRSDVERTRPAQVFLGHIHAPLDGPPVHYAGSPCPLDVTETGRRRFLVYDTVSDHVSSQRVETPVIYFQETLIVLPLEDEEAFLRQQIEERIRGWQLREGEAEKVQVRVKVSGYSTDKRALQPLLQEAFDGFSFYQGEAPDVSGVYTSSDVERDHIVQRVRGALEALDRPVGPDEPTQEEILAEALRVIYGA